MASDNIFSGLKVVDFASFIAGPSAAVILSDFGADVIKVEPPSGDLWRIGNKLPPQPVSEDAYPWHLANRNKRGMALDLKSPNAQQVLEKLVKWADVLIVNTPHPARARLKLEYQDVVRSASVSIQAALCDAKFFGLHDRMHPANAAMNVYRAKDGTWFVLIVTPDRLAAVAKAIGRPDLLTDPRFSDPAKLTANMPQLTAILDEIFCAEPMAHWYEVFNGVHVTFGAVRRPQEVIKDPQLQANDITVPLHGAGGQLTSTISSPLQVHGVAKVSAKRAPKIGEHNDEVLRQLGFSATEIDGLRASGAVPKAKEHAI